MNKVIRKAIANPDDWVLQIDYRDKKGTITRRVVSPIRLVGKTGMLALCLCREESRQFNLSQCSNITLLPAADVLMPVPMRVIENNDAPKTEASGTTSPVSASTDSANPSTTK